MHENNTDALRRAVIIAADCGEFDMDRSLLELRRLAETANVSIAAEAVQRLSSPDPATYLGSGRLEQAAQLCELNDAELLLANDELSPAQLRNIEQATDLPVIDRTMLILDIFAASASSAEGKLQVEQAQLHYRLPRLIGAGKAMSRLGGGIGTRGPGETKLETDRRHIRARLEAIDKQMLKLRTHRETTRRARQRSGVPVVALVGYTNVGKSSLMNALTGADVPAQDKLFATLDTTMRKIETGNLQQALLVDTVGFVSRLPHHLVEAFKSTLEEIKYADLLLYVADAADPQWGEQLKVAHSVVEQLGCSDIMSLTVFNKCDLITQENALPGICVSAASGAGLEQLTEEISSALSSLVVRCRLLLPYSQGSAAARVRQLGNVLGESYGEDGITLDVTLPRHLYSRFAEFDVSMSEG